MHICDGYTMCIIYVIIHKELVFSGDFGTKGQMVWREF